jgi:predicted dehydrogenase
MLDDVSQPFNQHRLFLDAVRDGTQPLVTLEDGLQDLAVVAAFYNSVRLGACVAVEPVNNLMPITARPV